MELTESEAYWLEGQEQIRNDLANFSDEDLLDMYISYERDLNDCLNRDDAFVWTEKLEDIIYETTAMLRREILHRMETPKQAAKWVPYKEGSESNGLSSETSCTGTGR